MGPPTLPTTQRQIVDLTANDSSTRTSAPTRPRILRSAFIPQRQWTRTCEMVTLNFCRTSATYSPQDGLLVRFSNQRDKTETIEIAKDHESSDDAGFIGKGYTKRGVYVCDFYFQNWQLLISNRPVSKAKNMC